jgi:hypothetical protein
MSSSITLLDRSSPTTAQFITHLFDDDGPFLVEVAFPRMGTSSDWHLLREAEQLSQLISSLGVGVELFLTSVWSLDNRIATTKQLKIGA